mmetsp:Transcript_133188/g.332526  ORF Transcript_133188/g.332526 Transcript_133188/m.332526 type:complete len:204 (-) Transcript_133188:1247-1858(-)
MTTGTHLCLNHFFEELGHPSLPSSLAFGCRAGEDLDQVLCRDIAVLIQIDGSKGRIDTSGVAANGDTNGGGGELRPSDLAITITVQGVQHALGSKRAHATLHEDLMQVIGAESATVPVVEMCEQGTQLWNGIHRTLVGNEQEDGLLQLAHPCIGLHTLHNTDREGRRHLAELLEPWMLQALRGIRSLFRISPEHSAHQVPAMR